MANPSDREKVEKVLERLMLEISQGLLCLYCAESVYEGSQRSPLMRQSWFFRTVQDATMRGAILALAKLTKKHKDSISVHYLFNLVDQNPRALCSDSPDTLRECVADHRATLDRFEGLIDSACEYRDRVVAHLDRKHVTQPSDVFAHPKGVNLTELGECLGQVLSIVNHYAGYYDKQFSLDHLKSFISGDVDILVEWMREYGTPAQWVRPPTFETLA